MRELYSRFCGSLPSGEAGLEEKLCRSMHFSEETYGLATSLFATSERHRKPHTFQVRAKKFQRLCNAPFTPMPG